MNWFTVAWCFIYCCRLEPVWYSQWSTSLACAIDGKIWWFSTKLPVFAFMCEDSCTWQMGEFTNAMKLGIQMNHRYTLESFRLVIFHFKPWWGSMGKWGHFKCFGCVCLCSFFLPSTLLAIYVFLSVFLPDFLCLWSASSTVKPLGTSHLMHLDCSLRSINKSLDFLLIRRYLTASGAHVVELIFADSQRNWM